MPICLKSVYAEAEQRDGLRVLVDRLWPRGMSRERLQLDAWVKELAPSAGLRRWFGHDPAKWEEFRQRYFGELAGQEAAVAALVEKIGDRQVTLLFSAKDHQHNNAVALRDYLKGQPAHSPPRPGKETP
jgi:uncharacterized protein YeaO (DUF488 family)